MSPAHLALAALAAALALLAMEPWAALLHGRLWHGPWWPLHQSHHRGRGDIDARPGAARLPRGWQLNDALSLMHAPPAALFIYSGLSAPPSVWAALGLGVGAGMSLFGALYLLVHDGFVHGRLPLGRLGRWRYLRRVKAAHVLHHRSGGPPFGLFASPWLLPGGGRARTSAAAAPRVGGVEAGPVGRSSAAKHGQEDVAAGLHPAARNLRAKEF